MSFPVLRSSMFLAKNERTYITLDGKSPDDQSNLWLKFYIGDSTYRSFTSGDELGQSFLDPFYFCS